MEFVNKNVKMLDPFSPNLTLEQKEAILQECRVNPVYFYDRILGIKASRMDWDAIRTLPSYPESKLGDHDGDWLQDGFVCEPGIAAALKPGMGELHRGDFVGDRPIDWEELDRRLKSKPPTFPPVTGNEEMPSKSFEFALDFTPFVKAPLYEPLTTVELRERAMTAWNTVVEKNRGNCMVTEAIIEDQFHREIGLAVGGDRVKVKVCGGEASFYYRRNAQWIPL